MTARKVMVIEDEPIVARDMCAMLREAGYDVPPPVTVARDAEEAVARERPELVLLDICLDRGSDGISLGQTLQSRFDLAVVFVSAHSDAGTLVRAGSASPSGFVVKPFTATQLCASVACALGQPRPAPARAQKVEATLQQIHRLLREVELPATPPPPPPGPQDALPGMDLLTPREREVLTALLRGRRVRGIATALHLSPHTVRNHVKSLLFKLGVHSQEELIERFSRSRNGLHT